MRDKLIEILDRKIDYAIDIDAPEDEFGNVETDELADYLLENGVVVPPCKVGDAVWVIRKFGGNKRIDCGNVSEIVITDKPQIKVKRVGKGTIANGEFGKTVFLTAEEAEQTLTCQENRQAEKGGAEE